MDKFSHRCGTRLGLCGATMTSRTTPSTWSSTTRLCTTPCISPTPWVTSWLTFPRRQCCWRVPAQMSSPGKSLFFSLFFIFRFDPAPPFLFSVSFSASTSLPGTLIRSGWWTCRRARTPRPCVWVRAGLRSPPVRWRSAFSPLEGSREKSSACQVLWCVWLDTGSSCSSFTTGVRHTLFTVILLVLLKHIRHIQSHTRVCFNHQPLGLMGISLWVCSCCSLVEGRGRSLTANPFPCLSSPTCPGLDSQLRVSF